MGVMDEFKKLKGKKDESYLVTFSYNSLVGLTKFKFLAANTETFKKEIGKVTEMFRENLRVLNKLCNKYNYPIFKASGLVWEGVFFGEVEKINRGLIKLRKLDREENANKLIAKIQRLYNQMPKKE